MASPQLSLGPRTPDTVTELSVYNLIAHVHKMDLSLEHISDWMMHNWARGRRTPDPTVEVVRAAAIRLVKKGHVKPGVEVLVRCVVRQPGTSRGLPLFLEDPPVKT